MDRTTILNRIVQEDGNCCWSKPSICHLCPMGKLKKKPDGTWLSCIEAIGIENLTEEQADAKYKEVASRLLLDEVIDDILGVKDSSE